MKMERKNMEDKKIEDLKNEIAELESIFEKKKMIEELEKKKKELEKEIYSKEENKAEKAEEISEASEKAVLEEIPEIPEKKPAEGSLTDTPLEKEKLEDETEGKEEEKFKLINKKSMIFIGAASIIITIGIIIFLNSKDGNVASLSKGNREVELKVSENVEKSQEGTASKEVGKTGEVSSSNIYEEPVVKTREPKASEKEPEKSAESSNSETEEKVLEIPKDLKLPSAEDIEKLKKQTEEVKKTVDNIVEKKDEAISFFDNIQKSWDSFLKSTEEFFNNLFGNSSTEEDTEKK